MSKVHRGSRWAPEGRRQYWRCLGWSWTDDSSEKCNFLLSNTGFLAVSYLALVSGQQYDRGDHCEQESDVQFLTKLQAVVSSSCLARSALPESVMVVTSLLVALANPLHLPFRHIDTLSATSAGDLDLRFLMISTLVSGLILSMLTEAMLSINFCFYSSNLPTSG